MENKEGLIQVLEGIIQEIKADELEVEEIETIVTIKTNQNYQNKFNLYLDGYYKEMQ